MKKILSILLILSALFVFPGCGTLDKTGVYAGDQVLYQSELSITTSYDVIHTFVTWEKENRAALAKWPEIKTAADSMRAHAKQWKATADALHDAYAAAPTDANRQNLEAALRILRTALAEAAGYMAKATGP